MQVADVMTRAVITTTPATSLAEAVELMLAHRISALPVIGEDGGLCGVLSEGDLLRRSETGTASEPSGWRALLAGPERLARWYVHTHGRRVGEIMTREVISITPTAPLMKAVELMRAHAIKRLPVLADNGRLTGIISRADVLRALDRLLAEHATLADAGAAANAGNAAHVASPATAGKVGSDEAIQRRIQAELAAQRWLAPTYVSATVQDGTVELRGMVFGGAERAALRVLVENVPGVRSVVDHLVWVEPYTGTAVALPEKSVPG